MKKIILIQWLLVCCLTAVKAQVNFKDSSQHTINISWDNYSTSYLGEGSDSLPLIVSAIPYNGVYDHQDEHSGNTPMDMSFSGYRFRSQLSRGLQQLYTYDSGEVYFLSPGVFNHNAHLYEFRVLEDTTV